MKRINLSDISKEDPFLVPDGYLEHLPKAIQHRVSTPSPVTAWDHARSLMRRPGMQIAYTLIALVITVLVFVLNNPEEVSEPVMATTILQGTSEQEIITYLNAGDQLSIQELALEGNWNNASFGMEFGTDEALEEEIMQNIDTYSAEELWK